MTTIQNVVHKRHESPTTKAELTTVCLTQEDFASAVKTLSVGNQDDVDNTQKLLLGTSQRSAACRTEVIAVLVNALDKPDLDFENDAASYYLWRYGAELLGDLKAAEALDLLISHLDLHTSTFSSSMNHMPALRGVIKMGPIAIPKLEAVLKSNPDPNMRFSAVFCVATIGGPSAVRSLKEALATESDQCVSRFIRVSLDSFDEEGQIRDRGKWFPGGLCDE